MEYSKILRDPQREKALFRDDSGTMMVHNPLWSPYFLVEVGIWGVGGGVTLKYPCYVPVPKHHPKQLARMWGPFTLSSGAAWALRCTLLGRCCRATTIRMWKELDFCYSKEIVRLPATWYISQFFAWDDVGYFSFQVKFQVECGKFQCLFHQTSILKTACLGFQA